MKRTIFGTRIISAYIAMKATIDRTGRLTVIPENEIETYALRCYAEKFNSDTPPEICFQWEGIEGVREEAPILPNHG